MEKATSDSSCARKRFFSGCQIACIVGLVLVGGCWIIGYASLGIPHPDFTTASQSLSDFNSRFPHAESLQLPHSATNIFYAQSCRGLRGWIQFYRFDAPTPACVAYGRHLLEENRKAARSWTNPEVTDMIPLTLSPSPIEREPLDAMGLTKVDWFDVETVRSGFEGQVRYMSPNGMFWIDTDRGRFYFYSID